MMIITEVPSGHAGHSWNHRCHTPIRPAQLLWRRRRGIFAKYSTIWEPKPWIRVAQTVQNR